MFYRLDSVRCMNNENDFALVRKPSSAVEKAAPGAKRILSGMVADMLALVRQELGLTAEQNISAVAQNNLGCCYQDGQGVAKDYAEAVMWFRKAAEQNYAPAQNNLGYCYANGRGVERDYAKAVEWFRKAAEQNDAVAQFCVGICYEHGRGVSRDFREAYRLYKLAAEQNEENAVEDLKNIVTHMTPTEIAEGERRYSASRAQPI